MVLSRTHPRGSTENINLFQMIHLEPTQRVLLRTLSYSKGFIKHPPMGSTDKPFIFKGFHLEPPTGIGNFILYHPLHLLRVPQRTILYSTDEVRKLLIHYVTNLGDSYQCLNGWKRFFRSKCFWVESQTLRLETHIWLYCMWNSWI